MQNEALCNGIAGLCSGTCAAAVGSPLDTIRVRMQNGQSGYRSSWDCASDTVRRGGVRGLWSGCTPQIVSLSTLQSLGFVSFAIAIRWLEDKPDADTRRLWRTSSMTNMHRASRICRNIFNINFFSISHINFPEILIII